MPETAVRAVDPADGQLVAAARTSDHEAFRRLTVKRWMGEWIAASSDGKVSLVEMIDAGDVVVSVLQMDGIHDGPMGPMPASGRRFSTRGRSCASTRKAGSRPTTTSSITFRS